VLAVRGNIDAPSPEHPEVMCLDVFSNERRVLRILMTHIAVNGPRLRKEALQLAQKERAALVVCGHSHVPFIGRDRGVSVFNPGSIGPRRFSLPIVFGCLEIGPTSVLPTHRDCETGLVWAPPAATAVRRPS
jgi:uncharacterized protein